MSKFMAFAGTIAALSSLSFAWSISGGVFSNMGQPLPGVKITSSNYPEVNATTTDGGSFSISSETDALRKTFIPKESIQFSHNVISIQNVKANRITVSVMDALGKVAFSQTQHNVNGTLNFDLNRTSAKGAKFIRINADGHRNTYQFGKTVTLNGNSFKRDEYVFKGWSTDPEAEEPMFLNKAKVLNLCAEAGGSGDGGGKQEDRRGEENAFHVGSLVSELKWVPLSYNASHRKKQQNGVISIVWGRFPSVANRCDIMKPHPRTNCAKPQNQSCGILKVALVKLRLEPCGPNYSSVVILLHKISSLYYPLNTRTQEIKIYKSCKMLQRRWWYPLLF